MRDVRLDALLARLVSQRYEQARDKDSIES
jgi:hypothetical protein